MKKLKQRLKSVLAVILSVLVLVAPYLPATLAIPLAVSASGCNSAEFIQVINEIGPAVGVVLQIIALSKGVTPDLEYQSKVEADAAALGKLYTDLEAAQAANKGSILKEINGYFVTLQGDLSSVFVLANVVNPNTQVKLTSLVGLINGLVQIAEAALPQTPVGAQAVARLAQVPPVTAKQFVDTWNKTLTAKTGDAKVDTWTAKHQYHRHGLFLRVLSLGQAS